MKTFSKRLLTMVLAVSMVFGLSGMTTFAAEAEDAAVQDEAAEAEALSVPEESTTEETASEAVPEEETETASEDGIATLSSDEGGITTLADGEFDPIPVSKNGVQLDEITEADFRAAEKDVEDTVGSTTKTYYNGANHETANPVEAIFVPLSALLTGDEQPDEGCSVVIGSQSFIDYDFDEIFLYDAGSGLRSAVDGSYGAYWVSGFSSITVGHTFDTDGVCTVCGKSRLDLIDYNVKYAVCLWGIEQGEDRYGNTLGLTFGPATGADYRNDYVAHMSEEEYEASDDAYCIHWMTWEEIIAQSEEDPTVFEDCLKKGCTHSVNLKLNSTLLATSYENQMNGGDGAGMLYDSVASDYRSWNASNSGSDGGSVGWPASQIRAVLNGKDRQTDDTAANALDSSDCLLSCFPSELQNGIVATAVTSDTVSSSQSEEDAKTTYDKLWLPSGREVYKESADGENNGVIRANEGTLSTRSLFLGITTKENLGLLADYDEKGAANEWRLRSLSTSDGNSYQVAADGNFGASYYTANTVGIAPCFSLQGTDSGTDDSYYDVKYAVSIWGINHDIDEKGNILGLTFGPATGADYRNGYVAHMSEEEYEASDDAYCIHWMTWEEIADQAADDPTVFQECLESGCTHSVNITLNDTIRGASYADEMDDGDGVSGLLNCIKLWSLDPPYEYISTSYRQWNSFTWEGGGWAASQIRAVLNGKDALLGEYADNALDKDDCLFSCFPDVLQKEIIPKAVPASTVLGGSEEKEDITLTGDSLWLFSDIEIWDYSGVNSNDSYLNPAEGALYERSVLRGVTTSNFLSALQNYDEEGTARMWWLRSINSGSAVDVVNNTWDYPTYTSATSGSVSCAPGFCLGVTNAVAGDKSALKAEYDADSELEQDDYTAESWEPFAAALADAKALLDAGAVTQGPLDAALTALQDARGALESAVNKTRLQAEYDEDILLKEDRYTAESWKPFADALLTAKDLLEQQDPVLADQDAVDAALLALQNAKAALVRKFDTSTVNYAVKIWGIGTDKYSSDDGNHSYTTGLTFGPATGADHLTSYVSRETVLAAGGSHDSEFCIHDMTWEEIIKQSKEDPKVFADCLSNGCTKAVELTPNEKLFSMTTLDNYLDQGYTGDGVSTLYYLLNGTGSDRRTYGANWNYSTSGYSSSNPANLYSTSRLRVTLNGDRTDAELKFASSTGDGSDLCDETDCLLSCFPEELQEAIVPRETVNTTEGASVTDKTTYDKLFLFSLKEGGISDYSYDGGGGNDYGVNPEAEDRYAYEFTGTDASSSTTCTWWSRSRRSNDSTSADIFTWIDSKYNYDGQGNISVTSASGVSPGFSLPGPVDKSGLQEEYDADSQLKEADYTSWSWGPFAEAMAAAEEVLLSDDVTQEDVDEMLTELKEAREALVEILDVSFTSITAEGIEGGDVTLYYGADIELATDVTYKPSDATLAYQWYEVAGDGTETAIEGETEPTLTLSGAMSDSGTYKCVVTASSDRQDNVDDATSITVTVTDEAVVNYAVKIWGIGHDTYSYETKKITHGTDVDTMTAGLTFGPATGDNEAGDGTGFLNTYKAHLTEEQYDPENEQYCIHWMSWEEIAEQSKSDPSVFDACMNNGCTKAVEISLNEKLANRTTVNSYLNLEKPYTGDGVSALYYLINGTNNSTASYTYGANWNYSTYSLSGTVYTDCANLYSRSRIRTTLTGDSEDAREQVAAGGTDYYDLATVCDETNCLFSCFPEELQEVIVPRLTLNSGGPGGGNAANRDQTDTFDKLFLFSLRETGLTSLTTGKDFDDSGGSDYGVNASNSDRIAYEFTGTSATDIGGVTWWTRSRYDDWSTGADRVLADGSAQTNLNVAGSYGLAPGFCLPGPDDEIPKPTVSDVTVTSDLNGNTKAYDGKGVTLTVSATTEPETANVSYQWYKVKDGVDTAIDQATGSELVLDGNVSDSGTYKCVVSVQSGDETVTGSDTIDIAIEVAEQDISYASTEISKTKENQPFTNELTMTFVDPADGSGITYASSDESVATVDKTTGEVTIVGVGETTITATAAATDNCGTATASYTLTVTDETLSTTVRYAVKVWGIQRDTYKDEDGNENPAGLTFGPAVGENYINSYKAHLTEEEYAASDDEYCIHWMSWDEIIEQSKKDPEVFADCLSSGCTKAVELTPNEELFNQTTVANVLQQNYSGDGVGTLYYLLSGTTRSSTTTQGEAWNYIYTGYSDADPANVYSRSRIRNILTGDKTEIEEWITEYPNYNDYYGIDTLCDEKNCLLTCFPEELQNAIVPRETVNAGKPVSGTSYNDKTTYDQLFLFSTTEVGFGNSDNYDDGGGTDYGVASRDSQRVAYEFTGVDGATSATQYWWTRSRCARSGSRYSFAVNGSGTATYAATQNVYGVSPGFCLEGPEPEEPTVSVTIGSTMEGQDDTKTYDGVGVTLTATATVEPESAEISSYQWYKDGEAIEDATYAMLNIDGNVSDSGTYKCVVTATNDGLTADAAAEIAITIEEAIQEIVFEEEEVTKTIGDGPFTNELSGESVVFGTVSYESSNDGVATVDENGLVTLVDIGETTITATAAGSDKGNYDEVTASYTLTVAALDKTALQEEYDEDILLIESDYTAESWEPFAEALNVADGILTGDTATQDEVNTALENLQSAKGDLKPVTADKTALEDEIAATDDLVESDYTEESWADMQAALEEAKAVEADEEALQSAVDKAAEDLQAAINALSAVPADKDALEDEIAATDDLVESDYTEESWADMQAALDAAEALDADADALQSAVDKAAEDLQDAIDNLDVKTADKTALEDEIAATDDLVESDYTADSWTALTAALEVARTLDESQDPLQSEVDAAAKALQAAIDALEEIPADKSILNAMINAVEALDQYQDYYTKDSWNALQEALNTAKDVAADGNATQSSVNSATTALLNAFGNLIPEEQPDVDKSILDAAVKVAEALVDYKDNYTKGSWDDLQEALAAAETVLADPDVTQDDVNKATVDLVAALADLEPETQTGADVDKSVLNAAIAAADALEDYQDYYTEGSWSALQDALKAAKDIADNDEATQDDVNEATVNLVAALTDLEPVSQPAVDKSVLDAAVQAAEALEDYKDNYTKGSWNDLQDALSAAQDVAANGEATQEEVNNATSDLVAALADLEPVSDSGSGGSTKNGLYQITPGKEWGYYVNGEVDTSYTGFQTNSYGSWYVENGYIHFDKNSVYKDTSGNLGTKGDWYYVIHNKVQYGFTGLANYKNQNGWWYIKSGKVDFSHNGVDKNVNGWWYVTGGKVQFGFTGLAHYRNANGWWYIKNGKVDFTHNGVDKNQNGWWYVTGGKVQFGFTGLANYKNANGWWYIKGGKVTFDYTGIALNQNGTWYVKDSKVDFSYNGRVTSGGTTYTVRNGKVT